MRVVGCRYIREEVHRRGRNGILGRDKRGAYD